MHIPINRQSKTPLYQQVENYLRLHIQNGQLAPNTRLPASRKLANDLGISRITVQNAYANLESEGLIISKEGSGAYVAEMMQMETAVSQSDSLVWPFWQQQFSSNHGEKSFPPTNSEHKIISFTGVGDPQRFPIKDLQKSLRNVLHKKGAVALAYSESGAGYFPLRQTIAHILASQGIQTNPNQVLITSGSQQALALVCQLLLSPNDVVVVAEPTYNVALDLFRTLKLNIISVPVDNEGMRVDLIEPLLQQHHPKLIYTIPNFQNPSGVCLSGKRRRQLLALAMRYNLPILEDDFVGDLRYNGRSLPPIKALDRNGHVIYVGTFSKMLMPGLRVGYLVADGPIFNALLNLKQVSDINTSTLMQHALNEYVSVGRYQTHLRHSTRLYRQRRDAMIDAIKQSLPATVAVSPPQGGLFVWLHLPPPVASLTLLTVAKQLGVVFAPGNWFFPDPTDGDAFIRLNFASQPLEDIKEGIKRLSIAIDRLQNN